MILFFKKDLLASYLQQDIIKIGDQKIFTNPFLYSRRLDQNSNKWLREIGQIEHSIIVKNRLRFYPEIDWSSLTNDEKYMKDASVEMFLKTLEIIKNFNPNLTVKQINQVEKKILVFKKKFFEIWVQKKIKKNSQLQLKEAKRNNRETSMSDWKEWLSTRQTQKAFYPFFVIIIMSLMIGWFTGVANNSCNPYFESTESNS
mgnify:CR=1 FL=1